MVRAFLPQGRNQSIVTNTNYPPQKFDSGKVQPSLEFEEAFDDGLGDTGFIEFQDTSGTGLVEIIE